MYNAVCDTRQCIPWRKSASDKAAPYARSSGCSNDIRYSLASCNQRQNSSDEQEFIDLMSGYIYLHCPSFCL